MSKIKYFTKLLLLFLIGLFGSLFCIVCYLLLPERVVPPERNIEADLQKLTPVQRTCIEKFLKIEQVIFVEPQPDVNRLGVGYVSEDSIYAALLQFGESDFCELQWQEFRAALTDYQGKIIDPVFKHIQVMELTGDDYPDLYVWVDYYGVPRRGASSHIFYIQQADGTYEREGLFNLCLPWNTVTFTPTELEGQPLITVKDDLYCDSWNPSGITTFHESFMTNEGMKVIRVGEIYGQCFFNCWPRD